jgi:hypothetical protein
VDWHKLVFSAKESVYKAYYPLSRTFLDFHDVDVVLDLDVDPDAGTFAATLVRRRAPTVAGARTFHGRYAFAGAHVFTAVVLPSEQFGVHSTRGSPDAAGRGGPPGEGIPEGLGDSSRLGGRSKTHAECPISSAPGIAAN